MTKKIIAITSCFLIFCNLIFAQKKEFYLAPQVGLLNGNFHASEMFGLTAGVATTQWVYAVGASVDYYKSRSAPVFAEVKRMFADKKNTPFLYANAGINVDWVLANQHQHPQFWGWGAPIADCSFSSGRFLEGGAGVNLKNKEGKGFILSLGYSSKSLSESWTENIWEPNENKIILNQRSNKYSLNRIVFKVGFRIF